MVIFDNFSLFLGSFCKILLNIPKYSHFPKNPNFGQKHDFYKINNFSRNLYKGTPSEVCLRAPIGAITQNPPAQNHLNSVIFSQNWDVPSRILTRAYKYKIFYNGKSFGFPICQPFGLALYEPVTSRRRVDVRAW